MAGSSPAFTLFHATSTARRFLSTVSQRYYLNSLETASIYRYIKSQLVLDPSTTANVIRVYGIKCLRVRIDR